MFPKSLMARCRQTVGTGQGRAPREVTEWNVKACSLLGFTKSEAMGKSLVDTFITEEFKGSVNSVLKAALMGKD